MKKYKYDLIFFAGLFLWLAETWYFGWNETALSNTERALDMIASVLVIYGALCSVVSNIKTDVYIVHTGQGAVHINPEID